jgi:hypothetical protein
MPFSNHSQESTINENQNESLLFEESFDLEDFFDDEYVFFGDYADDRDFSVQLNPSDQKMIFDEDVPRRTMADVFPDNFQ